jgi:hypothetical protein
MTIPFVIAVAVLLGLVLFLIHEVKRSPGPMRWGQRPVWKKRIRVALAVLPLIVACLGIWAFLIEPNRLVVRQQTIQIASWPGELSGLRIAVISDIHSGASFIDDKKLREIVALTNQQSPDLVVLPGDFMVQNTWHGKRVAPESIAAILKDFRAPLGSYAVLGNHDWWDDGELVRRAFESNGIRVLENDFAEIKWQNGSLWLVGLSDLWTRPQRIGDTVKKIPEGATMIAMTHNPDTFPLLPERVPLMLAGHTHGGQVNIPLIGTPITPSRYGSKYASGHLFENGHHLFVTTGIGTSIFPVRFRVPPEIVILTITR